MKAILFLFLFSTSLHASLVDSGFRNSLVPGKRTGLHGQVIFGVKRHYMSHIPMLNMPHDIQILTRVKVIGSNGEVIEKDFSNETFTVKPALSFSLNDFVKGTLKKFKAAIYKGSFELKGEIVEGLESIYVEVLDYIIVRHLPSTLEKQTFDLEDESSHFKINLISSEKNIQEIINAKTGKRIWCVKGPDFFRPCDQN